MALASPAFGQDPVKVDPAHHKVEFENAQVRVLRVTFGPGEKTPTHEHPAGVAVFLTDGKNRVSPEGRPVDETPRKAGGVVLVQPGKHTVENLGTSKVEIMLVELKGKPAAAAAPLKQDSVKVDPKHYKVEAENDRVRVLRIKYGPGEKSVMHDHPASVVVILTDGTMKFTEANPRPGAPARPPDAKAGQTGWADAETHLPENVGGTPMEAVLIELK